jgi:hypothetical protein
MNIRTSPGHGRRSPGPRGGHSQWVWDWPATRGTHVIEARATDRTGYTQTAQQAPPEPNGATGYPQVAVQVGA